MVALFKTAEKPKAHVFRRCLKKFVFAAVQEIFFIATYKDGRN